MHAIKLSTFFFFLSILSFGQQKIEFNEGKTKVEFITPLELDSFILKDCHILDNASNKSKLFLDEKSNFLFKPDLNFVGEYDSVKVTFDYDTMFSNIARPILISGLEHGPHKIDYTFYKNGTISKNENASNSIKFTALPKAPLFKNDAIVIGLLLIVVALVFYTSSLTKFKKFYAIVPGLLLCYIIPALLNTSGIISGEISKTYFVASRYLLPASLILLCLSVDLKEVKKLGSKAVIMFFAGTVGIIIGGPIALFIVASIAPDSLGADAGELWRGLPPLQVAGLVEEPIKRQ